VSALAGWAVAAASVGAAAPPVYTYVELERFDGSTIPAIELSLNDRGEIAWTETDAFEKERLWVRSPQGPCKYVHDTDQADRGRVGPGVGDGIGDACQCTELTGDGSVGAADVTRLRQHLAGIGAPLSGAPLTRCSAIGGPNECTVRTLSVLRRALAAQGPGVAQVCDAAVP